MFLACISSDFRHFSILDERADEMEGAVFGLKRNFGCHACDVLLWYMSSLKAMLDILD